MLRRKKLNNFFWHEIIKSTFRDRYPSDNGMNQNNEINIDCQQTNFLIQTVIMIISYYLQSQCRIQSITQKKFKFPDSL